MDIKAAHRSEQHFGQKTCSYWLAGRCNRNPCRFLHSVTPSTSSTTSSYYTFQYNKPNTSYKYTRKPHSHYTDERTMSNHKYNSKSVTIRETSETGDEMSVTKKPSQSLCRYWVIDNCVKGDNCQNLHSWFTGDGFSTLAKLKEHKKVVTWTTLPEGSDKLYSGSTDGTVRTWDCHTGQCTNVRNCGSEVNSLISEGRWIFVGLHNVVKAWNIQNGLEFTLDGPRGKVLSMVVGNDTLFAGAQVTTHTMVHGCHDGVISAWRGNADANSPFELVASLNGHTKAIACLTVGRMMLFSRSMDHSIKVWDLETLQCKMTLNEHPDVFTSLICWDSFLLSSSSDSTIKIWVATEEGAIKVVYTHTEENGILALSGMSNAEGKPILFSSSADNSVRLYELTSWKEVGYLQNN